MRTTPQTQTQTQTQNQSKLVFSVLENIKQAYLRVTKKEEKMKAVKRALEEEGFENVDVYWSAKRAEAYAEADLQLEDIALKEAFSWLVGKKYSIEYIKVVATTEKRKLESTSKRWEILGLPYAYGYKQLNKIQYKDTIEAGKKTINGVDVYIYIDIYNQEIFDP